MGNFFAYMRISTKEERGKQRYTRQEAALNQYAEKHGFKYLILFKEDKSGKSFQNREQWLVLETIAQEGDTIVCKSIDRFTREAEEGYRKYMDLLERGVELVFLDNPTVSTAYIKRMMGIAESQSLVTRTALEGTIKLLLIVELDRAEQERLILSQRTKDGMAASPNKAGRKPGTLDKLTDELREDLKRYNVRELTGVEIMRRYRISRNTLKKYAAVVRSGTCTD